MTNPFIEDIKNQYKNGSVLIKLILINLAIFLAVNLVGLFLYLFNVTGGTDLVVNWFSLPAEITQIILQPWSVISYMFTHKSIMHIVFNMLVLYFSGNLFIQFLGEKKLLTIYLLGGFAGGFLYILSYNLFPVFAQYLPFVFALGASASVMAILVAVATYAPDFNVRLMFIGNVKLKYIAMFYIVLDLVSIEKGNPGGHLAHLGGALFGIIYIQQLKKGKDFTMGFSRFLDYLKVLFKPRKKMKVVYKKTGKTKSNKAYNEQKVNNQKQIDAILDKITKSGYDSLTKQEKAILFDASGKK